MAGLEHGAVGMYIEDMWRSGGQSGARVHLRWQGQCIEGSDGCFGAMVE